MTETVTVWTSQYQLDEAINCGFGYIYAEDGKPEQANIPLSPRVAIPAPRGGLEPNWWEEWVKTTRAYNALAKAAQAVVDEAKSIHDNDPWPIRYRAPYEAITKLSAVLEASDKSVAVAPPPAEREGE
jgi:hypothetical protein